MTLAVRFWAKVDTSGGPEACWPWTASVRLTGYGQVSAPGRGMLRAHRVAWELVHGSSAGDVCVLHRCDNRACCNPAHLFLGTQADNMVDMWGKGRGARGPKNGHAKLTDVDVSAIRRAWDEGASGRQLVAAFGVTKARVSEIVNRKAWRHVD